MTPLPRTEWPEAFDTSGVSPHQFSTKRAYAAHIIRRWILDGRYAPGQRLREEQLAVDLAISPTPIREALLLLEAEGLVVTSSHRGASVVRLTAEEVADTYRIRAALESLATTMAMEQLPSRRRDGLLAQVRRVHEEMGVALAGHHLEQVPRLNREFHWLIYRTAGSARLLDLIERLWNSLPHFWLRQIPGRAEWAHAQHELILAALATDGPEAATSAMRDHVQLAAETLVAHLRQEGAPPGP